MTTPVPGQIDPRLERLLGGPGRAKLRQRLRRVVERRMAESGVAAGEAAMVGNAAGAADSGLIRLDRLSEDEHATLAAMLGRPARPTTSMTVDLAALDAVFVRAGIADSLRDALERLDGPIVDRRAIAQAAQARWDAICAQAGHPALQLLLNGGEGAWDADPGDGQGRARAGRSLLRRLARRSTAEGERLCRQAAAVLHRLPAAGLPRSQLAAMTLGDAHALDDGRPVATLVLAAWRRAREAGGPGEMGDPRGMDEPRETVDPATIPSAVDEDAGAGRNRDLWAEAGVLVNELARPVLVLNLPPPQGEPAFCPSGEPGYLSLRRLLRGPPRWSLNGQVVFVCENPNIVAWAADRLGPACAPVVCTDGMPAAAQRTLLTALVAAGARLRYHGDFDWAGIRIANAVCRRYGAAAWRMGAGDYRAAVASIDGERHPLAGQPIDAVWDDTLRAAMVQADAAIAEESVVDVLLEDLGGSCATAVSFVVESGRTNPRPLSQPRPGDV